MADLGPQKDDFRKQLQKELKRELSCFNDLEQAVADLHFQLKGGYPFEPEEIAAMLRRAPEEIRFIIQKITNHLQQRELLHALPRRSRP